MTRLFRGRILHCTDTPGPQGQGVEYLEDGILAVSEGRITTLVPAAEAAAQGMDLAQCRHLGEQLLVPGFIDTHVHAYQIDMIASYGEQLLEWLNRYTFPSELRARDAALAEEMAEVFVQELLSNGTTSAMVFATSCETATDILFRAAAQYDMCMIAGKVLMDRNAPQALCDGADAGIPGSRRLIERWHRKKRLHYAVTPRFALTSSATQLQQAGMLLREHESLYMQTHLAENLSEVAAVQELFPDCAHYLDVYDRHGLCGDHAVFAHCVHLQPEEKKRLAATRSVAASCPSSNLFLGSGLFDYDSARENGVIVSLGSDVGAGTSLSMLRTLGDAYKVSQLQGQRYAPMQGFYSITLGNARALHLDNKVGNLMPGSDADFLLIDAAAIPLVKRRVALTRTIEEEWFAYMTLGDDRLISETWVAGTLQRTTAHEFSPGECH